MLLLKANHWRFTIQCWK